MNDTFGASAIWASSKSRSSASWPWPRKLANNDGREALAIGVVRHHGVVVRLAGEGDLVLGRRDLLGELHHVLVGLQVGIGLGQRRTAGPARRSSPCSATAKACIAAGSPGLAAALFKSAHRLVAGLDHGLERAPLVGHVALGGFDQVRNQVVAPLELHLDLRERVLKAVLERDELVVDARRPTSRRPARRR